jgi:hypothetical protein
MEELLDILGNAYNGFWTEFRKVAGTVSLGGSPALIDGTLEMSSREAR